MTRASLVILLLATGFVSGAEEAAEVAAKPPAGKFSNLARLFARESGNSPIGLLLSAYVAEEEGRMVKAAATYQDLLDFLPSTSRWGRVACVRMARCLLSQQIPKVDEAQAALDRLSSATDTTLDNERQLWAMVIRFHRSAEQWINAKGGRFDEHLDARIAQWTPPADMRQRFALSLRMLCNRFTRVKKNWEGVQFLRGILLRLKNPQLQRVAMRELVVKQLAADEPADALLTARAYWLSSIDSPGAFPEAIAVVVRCMRALKATKEQVEAYRIGQTYGTDVSGRGKGGIAGSRLRDLVAKHASGRSIIPQKFIDGETSPAARARNTARYSSSNSASGYRSRPPGQYRRG